MAAGYKSKGGPPSGKFVFYEGSHTSIIAQFSYKVKDVGAATTRRSKRLAVACSEC